MTSAPVSDGLRVFAGALRCGGRARRLARQREDRGRRHTTKNRVEGRKLEPTRRVQRHWCHPELATKSGGVLGATGQKSDYARFARTEIMGGCTDRPRQRPPLTSQALAGRYSTVARPQALNSTRRLSWDHVSDGRRNRRDLRRSHRRRERLACGQTTGKGPFRPSRARRGSPGRQAMICESDDRYADRKHPHAVERVSAARRCTSKSR
jgi:hypothetical protein